MVQTGGMDDRRIIDESGIEVYISGDAGDRSLVCILPDSTVCSVKLFVIISIPERIAAGQCVSEKSDGRYCVRKVA